jgi:capsular polysaccharide biosynthesis protein
MKLKELSVDAVRGVQSYAGRIAGCLPGSSIHFGPPRRSASTTSLHDPSALIRHAIFPARTAMRSVPERADPPLSSCMDRPRQAEVKEVFVAELPRGRYWGRFNGYIIDGHDTLLTDLSPTFHSPGNRHDGLNQLKLPPVREVPGTVAVINTLFANNFHHWLLDAVPRFEWLRRAGFAWGEIDHFILPRKFLRYHAETMELLGIDKSKVISSSADLHVRADRLLAPSHSEPSNQPGEYNYTPEGLQFVRDLLLKKNPFRAHTYPKRILISRERASSRRIIQAERVHRLLAEQGFAKVLLEDHSLLEQAAMFEQANCIVMPTGGNLANFVFCGSGTMGVEIFSKSYVPPFTYAFMDQIGLRYYGLVAETDSLSTPDALINEGDIDFDPERLADIVRRALSSSHPSRA